MKNVALVVLAIGFLFAVAASASATDWHGGPSHCGSGYYQHHHGHYRPYGYAPVVVVAPRPLYGYSVYPAPVVPVYPQTYYYGGPQVNFGYRGSGVSFGVRF